MPPKFGSGTKTLFAELLVSTTTIGNCGDLLVTVCFITQTKTQWLKKEVLELVAQEERLLYLLKTRLPNEVWMCMNLFIYTREWSRVLVL